MLKEWGSPTRSQAEASYAVRAAPASSPLEYFQDGLRFNTSRGVFPAYKAGTISHKHKTLSHFNHIFMIFPVVNNSTCYVRPLSRRYRKCPSSLTALSPSVRNPTPDAGPPWRREREARFAPRPASVPRPQPQFATERMTTNRNSSLPMSVSSLLCHTSDKQPKAWPDGSSR